VCDKSGAVVMKYSFKSIINAEKLDVDKLDFLMNEENGSYYIRITQTDHDGDGYDYYAFKTLRTNINTSFYDPVNKINVFA
jgi:hypothetical protein